MIPTGWVPDDLLGGLGANLSNAFDYRMLDPSFSGGYEGEGWDPSQGVNVTYNGQTVNFGQTPYLAAPGDSYNAGAFPNSGIFASTDPNEIAAYSDARRDRDWQGIARVGTVVGGGAALGAATAGGLGGTGSALSSGSNTFAGIAPTSTAGGGGGLLSNIISGVRTAGSIGGALDLLGGGGAPSAPTGSTGGNMPYPTGISSPGGFDLGNIFLPGGLQGGAISTQGNPIGAVGGAVGSGINGSPLNQADWNALAPVWNRIRVAANYGDISPQDLPKGLSPEATQFIASNWGAIRSAANLGDINWQASTPGQTIAYAQPTTPTAPGETPVTPAAPAAPAAPTSVLGDLEPARSTFANLATTQANEVDQNAYGNILSLLRQQAAPEEQRAFQGINQNLFSRGRLGAEDSATGEAYRGFARGQSEADLTRQLSAYGLSDALRNSALNRGLGAAQGASGLTALSTLPFDMALRLAEARSRAALGYSEIENRGNTSPLQNLGGLANIFGSLFGSGGPFGGGGRWGG